MDPQAMPEAAAPITKESLFPSGWDKPTKPEAAEPEVTESIEEEVTEEVADENLAEAQDVDEQVEEAPAEPEAALERMSIGDFSKQAGITQEEFYRDLYRVEDGKEVSVSQAFDERKALKEANDALLRERAELQEKVTQVSTQVPMQDVSPEAQNLANQAHMKLQVLEQTDWSQWEAGAAANTKLDLQMQAQALWRQAEAKQAEHIGQVQQRQAQAIEAADRETRSRIPKWNEATARNADWQAIKDLTASYGIAANEIDMIVDPRWRHFLHDALQARAKEARIAKGVKKVRKVGKVLSAGSRGAPAEKKPTLEDARKALADARARGASLEEVNRLRLKLPLGG